MLVLTRRINEKIRIGDNLILTVLEIRGDHVRLGIEAPRSVAVHREEVWLELQAQNLAAASPSQEQVEKLSSALAQVVAHQQTKDTNDTGDTAN